MTFKTLRSEIGWRLKGCPAPPPQTVKQRLLGRLAETCGLNVLVETGTYTGDTVAALEPRFRTIHTIELSPELVERAKRRFSGNTKITVWQGDSGTVLPQVLAALDEPILFWLDGHYSGGVTARGESDTPIMSELQHIRNHQLWRSHAIVIDDAREFNGEGGYPSLSFLQAATRAMGFTSFNVQTDMIIVRV